VDKDGDIIKEDDKGAFHKDKNNAPAVPLWDAGVQLQATAGGQSHHLHGGLGQHQQGLDHGPVADPGTGTGTPPAAFTQIENLMGIDGTNPDVCAQIKSSMATPIPAKLSEWQRRSSTATIAPRRSSTTCAATTSSTS